MSQVWWPIMAAGCVIGVDLGGTKLLAGTVDSKLEVHHRAYRLARPDDTGALIDQLVEAVQEAVRGGARAGARRRARRSPAWSTRRRAWRSTPTTCRCTASPCATCWPSASGCPSSVDNDANAAMLVEWRCGEARGARRRDHADARHRHRRRAASSTGASCTAPAARPAELGHIIVDADGPPCPGSCPNHGCLEALVSGHAIGVEGLRRRALGARQRARARAATPAATITGALVTELAHDGDPVAGEVMTLMGERLGLGVVTAGQHLQPRGRRGRRRRDRRRRAAAGARRARSSRAVRCPSTAPTRGSCRPASAPSRGCSARPAWRSTWRGCRWHERAARSSARRRSGTSRT